MKIKYQIPRNLDLIKISGTQKRIIFTVLLTIVLSCQKKEKENIDQISISSEIDRFLSETGIPSVSFVLIKDGKVFEKGARGYSNLKKKVKVDTATYFNHGSNFKAVTSTAIMQLYERGLLDIDAPINDYLLKPFKNFDPTQPITARHLMSHQSGIPTSVILNKLWHFGKDLSFDEILEGVVPNAVPEEKFQYANDGFVLLAKLIEDITEQSYEDYITENILEPLGIHTIGYVTPTPEMVENMALPYHTRYNRAYPTHQLIVPQYPCGSVYLTPTEMSKFLVMHLNMGTYQGKSILKKESVEAMHTSNIKAGDDYWYGLGFALEEIDGTKYTFHQGSLPGYVARHQMDFESGSAVYVSMNVSASSLQAQQILVLQNFLMDYVKGNPLEKMEIPLEEGLLDVSKPSAFDLSEYVGNYKIGGTTFYFTIENNGGQLVLINPIGERFRVESLSKEEFFLTTENENITFERENGSISALFFGSGESKYRAIKER